MVTELKRKLAAILVADVVGYSRLIADDEEATLRRLEVFRTLWQDCVAKTSGRIFNTAGDAILAEFQSAVEAVRCAIDFQAQAKTQNDGMVPNRQMHFRIGITVGDVVERKGDLLGDGVNIAARLQTLAGPGGICVSSWVRETVSNKLAVPFTDLGDQTVKNIPTPIRAYLIGGAERAAGAVPAGLQSQDLLSRAVSSWKGLAALVGISAVAVIGAVALISQLRTTPPSVTPSTTQITPAPGKGEVAMPDTEPVKSSAPEPQPKSAKVEPASVKSTPKQAATPPATPPTKSASADPSTTKSGPAVVAPTQPPTTAPPAIPKADPSVRMGMLTEAAEHELRAGDRFMECETCPVMVVIPRGEFVMGSAPGQPGHESDEAPARKVVFGTRVAVARYAVTVGEFETFVAVSGYRPAAGCRVVDDGKWIERTELSFRNPGFTQAVDHPVVCVNWNDAKAFTDWMTARMNAEYRLPTEAEREYATRAGSTTAFWWGNDIEPSRAAYDWSTAFGSGPKGAARRGTHPVSSFQANPWGLFQMHGNVSEWVEDCWNDNYRSAPVDGSAWTAGDCKRRVLRGGAWGYAPKDLRSAYREGVTLSNRSFTFGFRVVRVLRGEGGVSFDKGIRK